MLDPDEPPAFEVVNPDGSSSVFLLCDHASPRLPRRLGTLGLPPEQLLEHIGWDIGAAAAARHLSSLLDAPLVLSGYSRLVIDCNRPLSSPTSIPHVTCGVTVPGNEALSEHDRLARQELFFWPYHRAIDGLLLRRPRPRALLSIHSFTPTFPGQQRPWPIAVLSGKDRRLAGLLLEALRAEGLHVGDNEPYRITDGGDYGVPVYGEQRGTPAVLIELRQDLVASVDGARDWAERLARVYRSVEPALPRLPAPSAPEMP